MHGARESKRKRDAQLAMRLAHSSFLNTEPEEGRSTF